MITEVCYRLKAAAALSLLGRLWHWQALGCTSQDPSLCRNYICYAGRMTTCSQYPFGCQHSIRDYAAQPVCTSAGVLEIEAEVPSSICRGISLIGGGGGGLRCFHSLCQGPFLDECDVMLFLTAQR